MTDDCAAFDSLHTEDFTSKQTRCKMFQVLPLWMCLQMDLRYFNFLSCHSVDLNINSLLFTLIQSVFFFYTLSFKIVVSLNSDVLRSLISVIGSSGVQSLFLVHRVLLCSLNVSALRGFSFYFWTHESSSLMLYNRNFTPLRPHCCTNRKQE